MSQQSDTRLMPAIDPTRFPTFTGSGSTRRGEVKAVGILKRQPRVRAWDELSEVDRAILLDGVRQRQEQRELQRQLHEERLGQRVNR